MKYNEYKIQHFLSDEFFIQWVVSPDDDNKHFWEKWLSEHPEKRKTVQSAAAIIKAIRYKKNLELSDKTYIDTFENIIKHDHSETDRLQKKSSSSWYIFFSMRKIAASIFIGLICWLGYSVISKSTEEPALTSEISYTTKKNPFGKKSMITLSEGTVIYLNAGSEIKYPREFSDSSRNVTLTGEAFFEVKKDGRPFIVKTDNKIIHVLGTSFNVNQSYTGDVSVALVSGKVRINDELGNQVLLDPKEMLVMKADGGFYKTEFDPLEIIGWKDKHLIFNRNTFEEVKMKIEKWYGVEVKLKGKIKPGWTYTGAYENETLENVLEGIKLTSGFNYKINNKTITISTY
ncbi:FecR family protein [Belliella kenyensis]|uniref:FecR family protein n=1 Tax=Belliella kenyensis TaxID=1472724 RepID=A0ABV8ERF7_9BACT|nr:FecR family protein [Belliella kenyensis]MCH7401649.1 FecR family protein [Belliella kenyensis]MDN3603073.1 FecR family protein [Belliella kenyensis]